MRGDMDKAIAAYKRALDLDPRLYDAALYAGDAEFKKANNSTDPQYRNDHFNAAGIWFATAIAIDANRKQHIATGVTLWTRRARRPKPATSLSRQSSRSLTAGSLTSA